MNPIRKIIRKLGEQCWALGFVRGGMQSVMEDDSLQVDWVHMPKDRWFADPFVLEVKDNEIQLLVEDYAYAKAKGIISLLKINRQTMEITARKELLELPTHLSFPCILRKDGHIYVYPESAQSWRLDMYEYHPGTETLTFYKTICDDTVWDSCITEYFGEPLLFTANKNDYYLDIYANNSKTQRFEPFVLGGVKSELPNSRMGGQLFKWKDKIYYPAQDCSRGYGSAIAIKEVKCEDGKFTTQVVKTIQSPHPTMTLGMHTLNEYKGVVMIDVRGSRYVLGRIVDALVKMKKNIKHEKRR